MSRGFVAIWYSGYGMSRPNPNPSTAEFWRTMVAGVLRAWRYHHPSDRLMFLDLDSQFNPLEHAAIRELGIEDGRNWFTYWDSPSWSRSYLDKPKVLETSPFDQTCLFDLDMLFVGNISRVFDVVGQVGVLGYPNYRVTRNRINTGLWVVNDKSIWPAYWNAVRDVKARHPFHDEHPLDLLIDRGQVSVTKLSPVYGMDPRAWMMRDGLRPKSRGWCDVQALEVQSCSSYAGGGQGVTADRAPSIWTMGSQVLRAIHMSGARPHIVNSPLWCQYMNEVTEGLLRR